MEVAKITSDSERTDSAPPWAAIRPIYEGEHSTSIAAICRRFGVTHHQLRKQIAAEGWALRRPVARRALPARPRVSRKKLITRMLGVLERQVQHLEEDGMATDKEVALLGNMARTLGKLMDIDKARPRADKAKAAPSADMIDLRKKIAERIDQLNRG